MIGGVCEDEEIYADADDDSEDGANLYINDNYDDCAYSFKISFLLINCMFVKPGVLINKEESEENKKWTDRALMLEYGRIDSIEVEEEEDGDWIQRIRARCFPSPSSIPPPRYGTDQHHQWSPWRQIGRQYRNPRLPRQLELSSSSHLSGYCYNDTGRLLSISMRNLDNGDRQVVGSHEPRYDRSLIVAPPISVESMLHLSHLSGDEEKDNWSICFNLI